MRIGQGIAAVATTTFLMAAVNSPRMTDCIFCAIANGELPSHTIYEDDTILAFLDANPLVDGHTLVIPKRHHETTDDMPASVGAELGRVVTTLAPAVEAAVDADASTIGVNNGPAAGQEIDHIHAHIIPRHEGDGGQPIHGVVGTQTEADDEELERIADAISGAR